MAIDCVTSGYAPFQGSEITENFGEYLKTFDQLLAYDFDTLVGRCLTNIGSKKDVEITEEFTYDVYNTIKRIHDNLDQRAVDQQAAKYIGWDNGLCCSRWFSAKSRTTRLPSFSHAGSIVLPERMFGLKAMSVR